MSAYDHLPPLKPPRSMAWYADIAALRDDALEEGLRLLDSLRPALPSIRASAIDQAQSLLIDAARVYRQAALARERLSTDPAALSGLLSPEKQKTLEDLCALLNRAKKGGAAEGSFCET